MKVFRWTIHATKNLVDREIDPIEAERTITDPEFVTPDPPDRMIYMRRYFDNELQQAMLLRVVIETGGTELVIVTLYKTSQINRYLKGFLS
jgi:hypothetical protein